jgi:hypothetical protein
MRTKLATFALIASSLSVIPFAHAEEAAELRTSGAPSGPSSDPNLDRAFLLPTAMTQPRGTLTYNNYELLLHGLTYGITDRLQVSVTVDSPISKDMPLFGTAALKGHVLALGRFHLALQGNLGYGGAFNDDGNAHAFTVGAGTLASFCLREDCSSLLSASATYQLVLAGGQNGEAHAIIYGGSIVHAVGSHVKLLGEVTSAAAGAEGVFENAPGVLASYGVRFHTSNIAADVGFIKPISSDGDLGGLLLGLPFVSVSYRW